MLYLFGKYVPVATQWASVDSGEGLLDGGVEGRLFHISSGDNCHDFLISLPVPFLLMGSYSIVRHR